MPPVGLEPATFATVAQTITQLTTKKRTTSNTGRPEIYTGLEKGIFLLNLGELNSRCSEIYTDSDEGNIPLSETV